VSGCFEQLISAITNPPVMAYQNHSEPFILHTDTSKQGLGRAIHQRQDGKELLFMDPAHRQLQRGAAIFIPAN